MTSAQFADFYVPWSGAMIVSATSEPVLVSAPVVFAFGGLQLPLIQLVLAVAGVLLARPLAPRREGERGLLRQILVTVIMLVAAAAWVIESQPDMLFTFVVAIGLGYSGYALIELVGNELQATVKRLFATISDRITSFGSKGQ